MLLAAQVFWSCLTESAFGIVLAWDPSPDANVVGYAIQYGTNSGSYQTRIDVGGQTTATIQLPTNGITYYFVATAYTVDGVESLPSNEVIYAPPATSTNATINFGALAAKTFGDATFTLSATDSSGWPVSFTSDNPSVAAISRNILIIVGAGSAVITASQAGNGNYRAAANVAQTLTVNKATARVTLSGLSATYDGTARSVSATTIPNGLPVTITYDGGSTAPVNAGSYAVVATINHANYNGTASGTLTIAQPNQTITFGALAAKTYGAAAFTLSATASSGLPVSFTSGNPSVAAIFGNTVIIVGAGSAVITASQAGNGNNTAAANVAQTLTVNKTTARVTLSGLSATYDGTARSVSATTIPNGLPVTITYDGGSTAPVNSGSYAVVATINHANYNGSASGTLTITTPGANLVGPSIVTDLQPLTVVLGSSVTFAPTITGSAPMSYQWWFNGSPRMGATAGQLVLPVTTFTDEGWYAVVATNGVGEVFSASVPLHFVLPLTVATEGLGVVSPNLSGQNLSLRTIVTLTAQPNAGWTFSGWWVGGTPVSTSLQLTLTMTAATTVTARFTDDSGRLWPSKAGQ